MPPKKGKGKGKGKAAAAAAAAAEQARRALLQLESEAEEFQECERRRRRQEETEERNSLAREEQLRQIREREKRIDDLINKVDEAAAARKDDKVAYESEIEQLSALRDSLLNEVSLLKAENEEQEQVFTSERQRLHEEINRLSTDQLEVKRKDNEEKDQLRAELCEVQAVSEETRQKYEEVVEEKEAIQRDDTLKIRALEQELQKALAMNATLQQAVESRESDDKKNVALMQMLNTQLEENRRHFDELLEDERRSTLRTQTEFEKLEVKHEKTLEEFEALKTEVTQIKQRADSELNEYQQQLEQVKFDSQYLNTELEAMRQQCAQTMETAETEQREVENANKELIVANEAAEKKIEALEALLYKKEREYYDKITFMNAQLTNNRTVISQLQNKLNEEREGHECELERRTMDIRATLDALKEKSEDEVRQASERAENEKALRQEVADLRACVQNIQSSTAERESELETQVLSRDDEIKRLRDILDANFIPHRKDIEVCRNSEQVDTILLLRDQLKEKDKELRMRDQAAADTEAWLKERIANQAEMIEALQIDLKKSELSRVEDVRFLEDEVARLKKTLDVHFISAEA